MNRIYKLSGKCPTKILVSVMFLVVCSFNFSSAETTGLFLKLPSNAIAQGTGAGYVAITEGIGSLGHNPAGLAQIKAKEIQTSYGSYLQGYNILQIGYGQGFKGVNLGVSITQMGSGDFEGRDENGYRTSGYKSQDRVLSIGMGKAISKAMTLGISGKYINSVIENEKASAVALDAGIIAKSSGKDIPITIGVSARNIGSKMKFIDRAENLPFMLSLGISADVLSYWTVTGGLEHDIYEGKSEVSCGMNLSVADALMLMGSYAQGLADGETDNSQGLGRVSGGMGIKMSNYQLDYAFVLMGELGNVQRFSLTFRFGQEREVRRQMTEGRRQKTEDRRQKAEDRRQKTEGRGQKAEGRGQKAEDRRQRVEGKDKSDIILVW